MRELQSDESNVVSLWHKLEIYVRQDKDLSSRGEYMLRTVYLWMLKRVQPRKKLKNMWLERFVQ